MSNFKRALEIQIFDADGKQWLGMKGLVNEADKLQRFAIVGEGYKVAQHEEVYGIIQKALEDLNLKHDTKTLELKNGARLRIDLKFPETFYSIAEEKITLWATFDNSYDSSTGLRLEIGAYLPATNTELQCSEIVVDRLNRYYHKHTKGLEVKMLEGTISKGIEVFFNEIKNEFEQLASTPIDGLEAESFIDDLIENKKGKIAKKYLESIKERVGQLRFKINNAWALYSVISAVLTQEVESIDIRKNNAREMLSAIKSRSWKSLAQKHEQTMFLNVIGS